VTIFPIANLNPYQNRWVIKARVTAKSDIRTWSNPRGEGKLFSIDLLDQTGEIRAVGFNEAVDKFYEYLEVGKVYFISRASLKQANGKFTTIQNSYEMSLDPHSEIALCDTEAEDVPTINFAFATVIEIEQLDLNAMIDLLAVVASAEDITSITTKKGDTLQKRSLTVVDTSGASIKLTLWGAVAETFDYANSPVYAFKALRISDFNGRSLSSSSSSTFFPHPDIREAHELRAWYDTTGQNVQLKSLSTQFSGGSSARLPHKTLAQVRDEGLGMDETTPDEFMIKGYVSSVPHDKNIAYPACPADKCNKKVIENGPGQWHCEKCNGDFPNCVYRYSLSFSVIDHTTATWVRGFDNVGLTILLQQPADTVVAWKNADEPTYHDLLNEAVGRQYLFKIRAQLNKYDDTLRTSMTATGAYPVDLIKASRRLLDDIALYN